MRLCGLSSGFESPLRYVKTLQISDLQVFF